MSSTAVALRKPLSRSYRKTAVLVGSLFLLATVTFATGSQLLTSYFSEVNPMAFTLITGVVFQVISALAGAGIGIAMLPILRHYNVGLARRYAGLRIGEGLMMIAAGVYMVTTKNEFFH